MFGQPNENLVIIIEKVGNGYVVEINKPFNPLAETMKQVALGMKKGMTDESEKWKEDLPENVVISAPPKPQEKLVFTEQSQVIDFLKKRDVATNGSSGSGRGEELQGNEERSSKG